MTKRGVSTEELEKMEETCSMAEKVFLSPSFVDLGMDLEECGEGYAKLKMPLKEPMKNLHGTCHGGYLYLLGDSATGTAVYSTLGEGQSGVTVTGSMDYVSNVKEGDIYAEAEVRHGGKNSVVCNVSITDGEGKLLAEGRYRYFILEGQYGK